MNKIKDISCPVCGEKMLTIQDNKQTHIEYEICPNGHGAFFDAGEFTDYKEETVSDFFKGFRALVDRKLKKNSA